MSALFAITAEVMIDPLRTSTSSPIVESSITEYERIRHPLPITVRPSNCTKGSTIVSALTFTVPSITDVSGRKIVTPSAISARAARIRISASNSIISAMVFAPSTSCTSAASSATTRSLAFTSSAAISVR